MPRAVLAGLLGVVAVLTAPMPALALDPPPTLTQAKCITFNPHTLPKPQGSQETPEVANAWQVNRLDLKDVHRLATGKGIDIAVIDTGVSTSNFYFRANNVYAFDMVPAKSQDAKDGYDCVHGTEVTSLIVANPPEGSGDFRTDFVGVAPDARVFAYRALEAPKDEDGNAQGESLTPTINAVEAAIAQKVRVINLSQEAPKGVAGFEQLRAVIQKALDAGIVVVASAGNANAPFTGPAYPANFPGVISVGASDRTDSPAAVARTAQDMQMTVAAPGQDVLTSAPARFASKDRPFKDQPYQTRSGTSFSAPIVSGVVALLLQRNPTMTPAQVRQRLIETADPPPASVPDPRLGYGIVNPMRALAGVAAPQGRPASSAPVPNDLRQHRDRRAEQRPVLIGLAVAGTAISVALVALTLRFAVPAARRRGYRPARPEREDSR